MSSSTSRIVSGYRTRLRSGSAEAYRHLHSRVPAAVELKLHAAGVLSWTIWLDGTTLFHVIETRSGYEEMIAARQKIGQVDAVWDEAIANLIDPDSESSTLLQHVWTLDAHGQR